MLLTTDQNLPSDAIEAGYQTLHSDKHTVYLGRVFASNAIVPASVLLYFGKYYAYTALGETAFTELKTFEVCTARC